jgi:hypothetical protein
MIFVRVSRSKRVLNNLIIARLIVAENNWKDKMKESENTRTLRLFSFRATQTGNPSAKGRAIVDIRGLNAINMFMLACLIPSQFDITVVMLRSNIVSMIKHQLNVKIGDSHKYLIAAGSDLAQT